MWGHIQATQEARQSATQVLVACAWVETEQSGQTREQAIMSKLLTLMPGCRSLEAMLHHSIEVILQPAEVLKSRV